MNELLEKIAHCVEFGKINNASPYPPDMRGQDGADELTKKALEIGINPEALLKQALIVGMDKIGKKFSEKKVFVPQMLMSAKAMGSAMTHLKPFFQSGEVKRNGVFVIGTVSGDLHDIGKNLVAMMVEGGGWEVIDLGVDVKTEQFLETIKSHPNCVIGLSALLTTTMNNMSDIVKAVKEKHPECKVIVGGAPLSQKFCDQIGADFYAPGPQGAVEYLNSQAA